MIAGSFRGKLEEVLRVDVRDRIQEMIVECRELWFHCESYRVAFKKLFDVCDLGHSAHGED